MSRWWTWSTVAKSRSLNASSPFFMSASRCVVRLSVSVVVAIMTPLECTIILVSTLTIYARVYSAPAAGTSGLWSRERIDARPQGRLKLLSVLRAEPGEHPLFNRVGRLVAGQERFAAVRGQAGLQDAIVAGVRGPGHPALVL